MIDNLFIVESPLQALVAVELSLCFKDRNNVIVYRLAERNRERNNQQIERVIENGVWSQIRKISFDNRNSLVNHLSIRKELVTIEKDFYGEVNQLFIGEFRSQWMHLMRAAVCPPKTILMDDGAATLTVKRKYIDNGTYFPKTLWRGSSIVKNIVKRSIYRNFINSSVLQEEIFFASAFLKSESMYSVDFSELKKLFKSNSDSEVRKKIYFFGSKYSESQIITLEYELAFIRKVVEFYSSYNCDLVYCAHRDESEEKLNIIKSEHNLEVINPDFPAEIYLLEHSDCVKEVAGAYSSVLNNVKILLPEIIVRSFYLIPEEINIQNREDILDVYKYFRDEGINVEQ